jgi:hypothetical protein
MLRGPIPTQNRLPAKPDKTRGTDNESDFDHPDCRFGDTCRYSVAGRIARWRWTKLKRRKIVCAPDDKPSGVPYRTTADFFPADAGEQPANDAFHALSRHASDQRQP